MTKENKDKIKLFKIMHPMYFHNPVYTLCGKYCKYYRDSPRNISNCHYDNRDWVLGSPKQSLSQMKSARKKLMKKDGVLDPFNQCFVWLCDPKCRK